MSQPTLNQCPVCRLRYSVFRTGMQYSNVFDMLWVGSADSKNWVYKRKGTVLRLFNSIKLGMWDAHIEACSTHQSAPMSDVKWAEMRTAAGEY